MPISIKEDCPIQVCISPVPVYGAVRCVAPYRLEGTVLQCLESALPHTTIKVRDNL